MGFKGLGILGIVACNRLLLSPCDSSPNKLGERDVRFSSKQILFTLLPALLGKVPEGRRGQVWPYTWHCFFGVTVTPSYGDTALNSFLQMILIVNFALINSGDSFKQRALIY